MDENDQVLAQLSGNDYVIPGRLIKQLVNAARKQDEPPNARNSLLKAFKDMGMRIADDYDWDNCCGDTSIDQVWICLPEGWELVFEFNAETGAYLGFVLGER
jgi:hypothetical protein